MINFYNCRWLGRLYGITIWPIILYREQKDNVLDRMRKHEEYHWHHQLKWGIIPWFVAYFFLWLQFGYSRHPFEIAAKKASGELNGDLQG